MKDTNKVNLPKDDKNKLSKADSVEAKHEEDGDESYLDPMERVVEEITTILAQDKSVREGVFRELNDRQREHISILKQASVVTDVLLLEGDGEKQNASCLVFLPGLIDTSKATAKQKALETIRAEINGLQHEVDENRHKATKLMNNAVLYAKQIGNRLLFAKENLLDHGEYEDWVEENFDGGLSTARAYTRIASYQNWNKIAPKLYGPGGLTLQQALAWIRERPAEKKKDSRKADHIKTLKGAFGRLLSRQNKKELTLLVYHEWAFMDKIEEAAEKVKTEGRREKKLEYAVERYASARNRLQRRASTEWSVTDELCEADFQETHVDSWN